MRKILWGVMALSAIAVGGYAVALLGFANLAEHNFLSHHYNTNPWALYGHLGLGGLALAIGPFQFLGKLRTKLPQLHRWVGRLYVSFCLLSGVSGLVMGITAKHPTAKYGFIALAIVWLVTTTMGYLKARSRDFDEHKQWMMRSYALTYGAVMLRIYLPLQLIAGVPFYTAYLVVAWAAWVPNLIIIEWWIRRQNRSLAFSS